MPSKEEYVRRLNRNTLERLKQAEKIRADAREPASLEENAVGLRPDHKRTKAIYVHFAFIRSWSNAPAAELKIRQIFLSAKSVGLCYLERRPHQNQLRPRPLRSQFLAYA